MYRRAKGLVECYAVNDAILQYFDRGAWALCNSKNPKLDWTRRAHLTSMAVHACQSLKEALDVLVHDTNGDSQLASEVGALPHIELIANVRNMDLHGHPLPVCRPNMFMYGMESKPGNEPELSSSHGVAVCMQMEGVKPKVRLFPKDLNHGKASLGGATVFYGCEGEKLVVHDLSTSKNYYLLEVLSTFLEKCRAIIRERLPAHNQDNEERIGGEPPGTKMCQEDPPIA